VNGRRSLIVIADDYGMGPATSAGILELGMAGRITGSVLLVNSPYAEQAVQAWRSHGCPFDLGWHPCLTMDLPVLPVGQVPTLVNQEGQFWSLGRFLRQVLLGRISPGEVAAELRAQYRLFLDMVGRAPALVNSHQHAHLFPPVDRALFEVLRESGIRPYVRRVQEAYGMLTKIPGARLKRSVLGELGRRGARKQQAHGFPGNDWLAGITDPPWVQRPDYLTRWLSNIPGTVVELACHPGYWDPTLIGRDCEASDGKQQRRVDELEHLRHASFPEVCRRAGFTLQSPTWLGRRRSVAA
jgi:predicted glycoside hydrolase/deacetylase ChbG (UPF0249 family)